MNRREGEFVRVYEEHVWGVYAFLSFRLPNREAAEDLTQATFERALRAWSRFDPRRGSERAWLLAIARNLLIDDYRARGPELLRPLTEDVGPTTIGPEERFSVSPDLEHALCQLSNREREVLALRYGGDLSGPETAALLGLTLANVQQIASRSLRKLRGLLRDRYTGPSPRSAPNATRANPKSSHASTSSRSLSGRGP